MTGDILEHYGVLGMKWGVRKPRGSAAGQGPPGAPKKASGGGSGGASGASKRPVRAAPRATQTIAAKPGSGSAPKTKSDTDALRSTVERVRLQKELEKLMSDATPEAIMRAAIERHRLETEYAKIMAAPASTTQEAAKAMGLKSAKAVGQVITRVAAKQAENVLVTVSGKYLDDFLEKHGFPTTGKKRK